VIKNIIFDIGNVLVKWQPAEVVKIVFPDEDAARLTQLIFKSPAWLDLNMGKMTENEIIQIYHQTLGIDIAKLNKLMQMIKESMLPVEGSFDLLLNLSQSQYSLYALTDNVHEIMAYLKLKYDFWKLFTGVICSADVGYLKPMPEIYLKLIQDFAINPAESVFIDDHLPNVEGARSVGLHSIQFISARQCRDELNKINPRFYCK
jgi:putative hydrolase of the HAD superfamily